MSFSIRQLIVFTSVVAICLTALANASRPLVPGLMQMFLFAVLASFAYGAYLTSGEKRAFRVGFLGWVVAMGTFGMTGAGNPYGLLQTAFNAVAPVFKPNEFSNSPPTQVSSSRLYRIGLSREYPPSEYEWEDSITKVGYCLIPMIWGFIGGWVTVFVYRKRERRLKVNPA